MPRSSRIRTLVFASFFMILGYEPSALEMARS
jgi:hypothetical protein